MKHGSRALWVDLERLSRGNEHEPISFKLILIFLDMCPWPVVTWFEKSETKKRQEQQKMTSTSNDNGS